MTRRLVGPGDDRTAGLAGPREQVFVLAAGVLRGDDVIQLLGSPSTTATFDDETWYYISQRTETVAFYAPETTDQKVLALKFDKAGLLKDMQTYTLKDGRAIAMVDRKTPTAGKELTLIEQVFGNIGKFSSGPSGPGGGIGTPGGASGGKPY